MKNRILLLLLPLTLSFGILRIARWTALGASAQTDEQAAAVVETSPERVTTSGVTHVVYVTSTENFANPERGFYQHFEFHSDNFQPLWQPGLEAIRIEDKVTLSLCIFYLQLFRDSPYTISQTYLDNMQTEFDKMRGAGMKCIVRFAYTNTLTIDPVTNNTVPPYGDASKEAVMHHLDQLEPLLRANADIIAVVQTGFIGVWGEWYYTDHFVTNPLSPSIVTAADYANRFEVTTRTLQALPVTRSVQARAPRYKTTMFGVTQPISADTAHNGSDIARTGHHNDCFLATDNDRGTYVVTETEYAYLSAETLYTPMGGETCEPNPPRSDCPTAKHELELFHWSYLNRGYNATVLGSWGNCIDEITRRLGYRFELVEGRYDSAATQGNIMNVQLVLRNVGYAAPFNPRDVQLILQTVDSRQHAAAPALVTTVNADPRFWLPGEAVTLTHAVPIPPSLAAGNYRLLLNLPDPVPSLSNRPEYSIRTANLNTWISTTGYNDLLHTVTITDAASGGNTYYVSQEAHASDTNPGTLAQPWASIQHAANTMVAGDSVLVRNGVYTAPVTVVNSGTATGGDITYKNYPGEVPVIDGSALTVPAADNGLFLLQDVSYVRIEGFELRNYHAALAGRTAVGIFVSGSGTHVQLINNHIHHITSDDSNNSDAHGIAVYGTEAANSISNLQIDGNRLHNLVLFYSEALVLNGNVEQFSITNNEIYDVNNIAIDLIGFEGTASDSVDQARDGIVQGNTIYRVDTLTNTAYLTRSAAGIYIDGGTRIRVEHNVIYDANIGIELASEHATRATSYITVVNNVIFNNHLAGIAMGGYDELRGSTEHSVILNNTLYQNDTDQRGNGEIWLQYDTRHNEIKNNIIWAGPGSMLISNYYVQNLNNSVDYNLYFAPVGAADTNWSWTDVYTTGFDSWKAQTGQDAHSTFANPNFEALSPFNWHLVAPSPAVDSGVAHAGSGSLDIDGQARVVGAAIDVGADETMVVPTAVVLERNVVSAENTPISQHKSAAFALFLLLLTAHYIWRSTRP